MADTQAALMEILKRVGAVIADGHFVGTSGRHMAVYVNKDALYPHPAETSRVGELFAHKARDLAIDVVVGPALGGIILSQWTAFHLSRLRGREVLSVYTEKDAGENQVFRRGYDALVAGRNVLAVEDVTTTGGSVRKVVDAVRAAGGKVVQAAVMVNRDVGAVSSASIGAPFGALAEIPIQSFAEEECPLCAAGVPVNTSVGHGRQFLERKGRA
jgi:orotate phosphoribosyltransferase